jgi:Fic family protein
MVWNWQQADWPRFSWDTAHLAKAEEHFLVGAGVFLGVAKHLGPEDSTQIVVDTMSAEAVTTSEIEGEILDRASVQSSIRKQLGLSYENKRAPDAEQGIATLMVDLYRHYAKPLTEETLLTWHRMLFRGRRDLQDVGCYRTGHGPMQVVSGAIHAPKVHFEAPPSSRVPREMARFVGWFNRTAPDGSDPLPALTRAGTAHLYFESIHPFEDGNGRIGRAIAEKALDAGADKPAITALAATILLHRKAYYDALEKANKSNKITGWLSWFAATAIEAQRRALAGAEFLIDKTRFLDGLRGQLNNRQEKVLLRMLREGPGGFKGGLSAGNYVSITGASAATATRDLVDLVSKNALLRTGELRHARYHISIPLRPVAPVVLSKDGTVKCV